MLDKLILDPEDASLLSTYRWAAFGVERVYFRARKGKEHLYLHRMIAGAVPGELVDHINGDTLDNRRSNLRRCDRSESNSNRRAKRTSRAPYKGITQTKSGRWLAQIMNRKQYYRIGLFDSAEEAAAAYDRKAIELHGAFSKTNGFVTYGDSAIRSS